MPRFLQTVACIAIFAPLSLAAQCYGTNCPERRIVVVTGTGTAFADADGATLHLGYKVFGANANEAYANASAASNAIMSALLHQGVPKSVIESSSQLLTHTPVYELNQRPVSNEERAKMSFEVVQTWNVRIKPDRAAEMLDGAIKAGANESGFIEWTVADRTRLQAEAAAMAVANARHVAETMMKDSGAKLGRIVSAVENQQWGGGYGSGMPIGGPMGGIFDRLQNTPVAALALSSRRVEVISTISATFAIE